MSSVTSPLYLGAYLWKDRPQIGVNGVRLIRKGSKILVLDRGDVVYKFPGIGKEWMPLNSNVAYPPTTWANRFLIDGLVFLPEVGSKRFFTDGIGGGQLVGAEGTWASANATEWTPVVSLTSVPRILFNSAIPIGFLSSGTVGANGALSGLASTAISSGYLFSYFPAGAVYSGSVAGFYLVLMLTPTTGTIYNNIYTTGSLFNAIPAVPSPIVAAGPGAYTQTTATLLGPNIVIPGGTIGNGSVRFSPLAFWSNTGSAKTFQARFGIYNAVNIAPTSGGAGQHIEFTPFQFRNRDPLSSVFSVNGAVNAFYNNAPGSNVLDTTVDQTFGMRIGISNAATDWAFVYGLTIELLPGV